jgi:hypothetical protein
LITTCFSRIQPMPCVKSPKGIALSSLAHYRLAVLCSISPHRLIDPCGRAALPGKSHHRVWMSTATRRPAGGMIGPMASEQKITLREMHEMRVCGLLIYSWIMGAAIPPRSTATGGPMISEYQISRRYLPATCCGKRGVDVRLDFNRNNRQSVAAMGYR